MAKKCFGKRGNWRKMSFFQPMESSFFTLSKKTYGMIRLENPLNSALRAMMALSLVIGLSAAVDAQTTTIAVNDSIKICEGTDVMIDVLLNDIDPDIEILETDIIAGPTSPLIDYDDDALPEGSYNIYIDPTFVGEDYILYEVCGEDDLCSMGVIVIIVAGTDACVWPGDANQDNICNAADILPIGLYYGLMGPDRDDDDGSWENTFADEWTDVPGAYYPNPKYSDINGDGIVDGNDTTYLVANYGFISDVYTPYEAVGGADDPAISLGIFSDTIETGTAVTIPIYFGTDLIPASGIYGIAFELSYDATLIDPSSVHVSFYDSWLGTMGDDMFALQHNDEATGVVEVAVTRNNQIARTGAGYFGQVSFVMEDNIAGKTTGQITSTASFCISKPNAVDGLGTITPVQISCDSVVVIDFSNSIDNTSSRGIQVFPNPASAELTVTLPESEATIHLINALGQEIMTMQANNTQITIPVESIPAGTYMIQISGAHINHTQQCIIQH